jgi:hypothetical protein
MLLLLLLLLLLRDYDALRPRAAKLRSAWTL